MCRALWYKCLSPSLRIFFFKCILTPKCLRMSFVVLWHSATPTVDQNQKPHQINFKTFTMPVIGSICYDLPSPTKNQKGQSVSQWQVHLIELSSYSVWKIKTVFLPTSILGGCQCLGHFPLLFSQLSCGVNVKSDSGCEGGLRIIEG